MKTTYIKTETELKKLKKHSVKCIQGVYFLWEKDALVYIGQSTNIFLRVYNHQKEGNKKFDSFSYVEINERESLDNIEGHYIAHFNPKYNKSGPQNSDYISLNQAKKIYQIKLISLKEYLEKECITQKDFYHINEFKHLQNFKEWLKEKNLRENLKSIEIDTFRSYYKSYMKIR